MALIGLDISNDVNKAEGYMMCKYDARKKFTPDTPINFIRHFPDYVINEMGFDPGLLLLNTEYTFNELVKLYNEDKESIDSFAETDKHVNFDNPTIYDALNLASDIDGCLGI